MRAWASSGWTLAVVEIGTGGSLDALLGDAPWLRFDESARRRFTAARPTTATRGPTRPRSASTPAAARELGGAESGSPSGRRPRTGDTARLDRDRHAAR